jgi:multiple sugar transport system substrate-binding protein
VWNGLGDNRIQKNCREARSLAARQLEHQLEGAAAARLNAHLSTCPACRHWARQEEALRDRLRFELDPPWTLTAAAATHNRSQILARVRRKSIMVQTRQAAQGLVALALLIVVAAGLLLWWQNNPPAPLVPDATPAPQEADQIVLTLAVEDINLARYRPLVDLFEEEHAGISVRLIGSSEVLTADEGGPVRALASTADVFFFYPTIHAETQYLLDLRPFVESDSQFDAGDFLPGLLPAAPEPLWSLPTSVAYQVTYFDKGAFAAAGLPYPALEWSTDEFLAAALALTARENDEVSRWGYVPGQMSRPPLLATQLTGPLVAGDSLRLADPDVVAAVQWLGDLFTVHQVSPWLDDYRPVARRSGSSGQSALGLIRAGQAAMWHGTHLLYDQEDANVGVTAVPRGQRGYAADPTLYAFAASRGTRQPEAAWRLLTFISRQPPQEVAGSLLVPARRSVATASGYWERLPADLEPALRYALENNVAPRFNRQASQLLPEVLAAHVDDGVPVAAALAQQIAAVAAPTATPDAEFIMVPAPVEEEPAPDTVQIRFVTTSPDQYRSLANQFQREQPQMRVTLVEMNNLTGADVLGQLATADCFVGNALHRQDEALRATFLPLDPLLELDGSLQLDDFYPRLVEVLVSDGSLWGLPAYTGVPSLPFDRRLFEEANLLPPPPDWTLADFLQIAQQLSTGEGDSRQFGYADMWPFLMGVGSIEAFGVVLLDDSGDVPRIDYQATAEMIAWHADLVRLYQVRPLLSHDHRAQVDELESLALAGRVALSPGGFRLAATRTGVPVDPEKVGVVAYPLGPHGSRADISTYLNAYHILADSPNASACWEWIKYLSTNPSAAPRDWFPGHRASAESENFRQQVGDEKWAIFQALMNDTPAKPGTTLISLPPWMWPGFYWLPEVYQEVAAGESDVATALAHADARFGQYRQCVIDQDAFDNYRAWRGCVLEVYPTLAWLYPPASD